jgi:hypothetical protein
MTGIAFCRNLSGALECEKLGQWVLGISNRRGQDKSRKVRPVGRARSSIKSSLGSNIANVSCNLRFMATRRRHSTFDTLRWAQ